MVMLTAVSADAQSKGTKRSGTKAQTTQHKSGGNRSGKKKGKQTYTNAQIRGLESERSQVQKDIKDQQNKLRANKADVEERLKNLLSINGEITAKQKDIDDYESEDISAENIHKCLDVISEIPGKFYEMAQLAIKYNTFLQLDF